MDIPKTSDSELDIGVQTKAPVATSSNLQLTYPLDPVTIQIIQELSGTSSSTSINALAVGTNTTVAASNTPTLIPLASGTFVNGITLNIGAGFTIVTAGIYLAIGSTFYSSPGAVTVRSSVYVNGAKAFETFGTQSGSGITFNTPAVGLLSLNVGDNVQLYGETSGGSTVTVVGASSYLALTKV